MDKPVGDIGMERDENVTSLALLASFLRLGASSFGGGMAGWTHREIVERRGWLTDDEFLKTLTVAQVMPGANPVNLAVYIGLKLRGVAGACIALFGMVLPAFAVILAMSFIYQQLRSHPEAQAVLRGLACVGIASSLTMGIKTARRLKANALPILMALAVFLMVGVLRWPLVAVVAGSIPVSVAATFWIEREKSRD
ncbi:MULTISPECIES: chromate transporter [unclassified Sinorhizobium]|uniref:chromate transporter n=1 Tax=unclassified Sinorhizobium TaxID=2613772 RepID=UPI0024C46C6E|nr:MULTISPECIES: chromate transporter [unclassified Sinorhizobium]MDK1374625.1 chromate transporter [Sinorhizobium sp. 6-70]MDK1481961.1 chromate transporter [Sinorhizobium sp. 6-117]